MKVKLTANVRYFEGAGPIMLRRTNRHIDGCKLFNDEFCGLVFSGISVDLKKVVEKSYDHGDVEAISFIYKGSVFYFLKDEIQNNFLLA